MRRTRTPILAVVAVLAAVGLTACDHSEGLFESPEELAAVAPTFQMDVMVEELGLEGTEGEEIAGKLETLHLAMIRVHELHPEDMSELTDEEKQELHDAFLELHERHEQFYGLLSEEQRELFRRHVHERMQAEHPDHDPTQSLRHPGTHDEAHGRHAPSPDDG